MPFPDPQQLPETVGVTGVGHLAKSEIDTIGKQTVSIPILSLQAMPVRRSVKASVKPSFSSTSSKMSVIRTDGMCLYNFKTNAAASFLFGEDMLNPRPDFRLCGIAPTGPFRDGLAFGLLPVNVTDLARLPQERLTCH